MVDPESQKKDILNVIVVTGQTGAGKSTAIKSLQDLGFYTIDNLPVELMNSTLEFLSGYAIARKGVALGMDIRDERFVRNFGEIKEKLSKKVSLDVVYISADDAKLATRYSQNRRRHPMLDHPEGGRNLSLVEAIQKESELLEPVMRVADGVIDTTLLSPHQLGKLLEDRYRPIVSTRQLQVHITSFGFKYGTPHPLDSLHDVRFLQNPYFDENLKHKTGKDEEVRNYIFQDPNADIFLKKLSDWMAFLLPLYIKEGKYNFQLGIGCTGGMHRSVAMVEAIAHDLKEKKKHFKKVSDARIRVSVHHRDLGEE